MSPPDPPPADDLTAPPRAGEELPVDRLADYLGMPVTVEQFRGGHSNLTYLLRLPEGEAVLRRAPMGPLPPKAHDMAREYRLLEFLHPRFPAAPRPLRLCEDPSIIGAVFYLMERRTGFIVRQPAALPAVDAQSASRAFVDCLAALHTVPVEGFGKPDGFLERQVAGWTSRWRLAATDDQPDLDRVMDRLAATIPASGPPALVHNDYKLDNVLFTPGLDRVEAVLDWEMATVGDPLADLGLTLCYWNLGGACDAPSGAGWSSGAQVAEAYGRITGRDLSRLRWYEALGVFKLAVILQQIYVRWVRGQTRDERFQDFGERVQALAQRAEELID